MSIFLVYRLVDVMIPQCTSNRSWRMLQLLEWTPDMYNSQTLPHNKM